jgi:Zn-dependent protease with chaperone function/RNA polymerase subunit RPABC4/transcription elongation factor Spt4
MESDQLQEFPGLSPAAFQHPLDVQAIANLRKIPLLAMLIRQISSSFFEKYMRLMSISSEVRLGPNQGGSIYEKFIKAASILDLPELPDVYVSNRYIINAYAFGIERYQITLFAGLIDSLSEEELLAVIGHELGHVKCEHMLYKTMAYILRMFGAEFLRNLLPAGVGTLATISLQLAILHWERMAEFSCDRASLLVVQDREVVASALSKLAGGSQKILPEINLEEVLQQAEEYDEAGEGLVEQIIKVNTMLVQTHPFPIVRAKEIMEWGVSEQYQSILQGDYIRQSDSLTAMLAEPVNKVCPSCGQFSSVSASMCLACGSSLKNAHLACAKCRIRVFPTWTTCPGCGSQLKMAEEVQSVGA